MPMTAEDFVASVCRENYVPGSQGAMIVEDIKLAAKKDRTGNPGIPYLEPARVICRRNEWTTGTQGKGPYFTDEARAALVRLPGYGLHF